MRCYNCNALVAFDHTKDCPITSKATDTLNGLNPGPPIFDEVTDEQFESYNHATENSESSSQELDQL